MVKQVDIGCLVSSRRRREPAAAAPLWIGSRRGSTWCRRGNKVWQARGGKEKPPNKAPSCRVILIRSYANYYPASAAHRWPPSRRGKETRSGAASASRQRPALTLGVTSPGQRLQLGLGFRKDAHLANTKTLSESPSASNSHHPEMIISFSAHQTGGGRLS